MAKTTRKNSKENSKIFAFIGVFLPLIGFLIVLAVRRKDSYAMHHAKQGLMLFTLLFITAVLFLIPIVGWFIIGPIGIIMFLVLWVKGIARAVSGSVEPLPIIGKFAA
jgi:uncharacterized membrane protein